MGQIIACCLMHNPQPDDPMLTSHDINMLLSIQVMPYVDDVQNFTRLQWVKRAIGKGPVCANVTDTHRRHIYWIYSGYFHLKFKHVNKSHISIKGFIVNKSWRLFQMPWFFLETYCPVSGHRLCTSLVGPPQCPTPRAPCATRTIFAPLTAGQAESFC